MAHDPPILFGTPVYQDILERLFVEGEMTDHGQRAYGLILSGMVVEFVGQDGRGWIALDERYPAHAELCAVLAALTGKKQNRPTLPFIVPEFGMESSRPLAFAGPVPFRILLEIVSTFDDLDVASLKARIRDKWNFSIDHALEKLAEKRVIVREGERLRLAYDVPREYGALVKRTAAALAETDSTFVAHPDEWGGRTWAFQSAKDGAPRLFATDIRLRNLMALAMHGPLLTRALRRITGADHSRVEGEEHAGFGRGGIVRTWETDMGPAVMLDPDHPLAEPLRDLLLAMHRIRCRRTWRSSRLPRRRRVANGTAPARSCSEI